MLRSLTTRFFITLIAIAVVLLAVQLGIAASWSRPVLMVVASAGLVLGFVALVLLNALFASGRRRQLARRAMVFSLAPPVLAVVPQTSDLPSDYRTALLIGSALWVILALIFSAFAVARVSRQEASV